MCDIYIFISAFLWFVVYISNVTFVQFDYPDDVCFDCSKCGLCCGDTIVKKRCILLLQSDAQKIVEHTNQPVNKFACKIYGKTPYVFEMRKSSDGKCVFLKDNHCTIYELRPLICKFYPVELTTDETGQFVFRVTSECPGVCCLCDGKTSTKIGEAYFKALLDLAYVELNPTI
jgi:Fe-S-cluster containining protein